MMQAPLPMCGRDSCTLYDVAVEIGAKGAGDLLVVVVLDALRGLSLGAIVDQHVDADEARDGARDGAATLLAPARVHGDGQARRPFPFDGAHGFGRDLGFVVVSE